MSRNPRGRRAAALAVLAPLATAGIVLTAAPANAIPTEGEPDATQCVRVVRLPGPTAGGSTLFVSQGYAAVLSSDC